jgi:RNA polymerase sigma factor (sigma-70 family)
MDDCEKAASDYECSTRCSLLHRLRDCQDQAGWSSFFELYWRLIYNVARQAGLAEAEAQDVVQNTFIYLSRRMARFEYNRDRGSFKSWLRVVTRSRIHDYFKSKKAQPLLSEPLPDDEQIGTSGHEMECFTDPTTDALDAVWQKEWEENLLNAAFRKVRAKVSTRQLLIFRLATVNQLALTEVAANLGVSLAQVYLARHRVGKLLKSEIKQLRNLSEI